MHEVAAGYLIAELTTSEFYVALLQTALTLPAFFLLLPSGALSDIFDRRGYLLSANIGMTFVALVLGLLTLAGVIQVWSLLSLTILMGIGTAMLMPAWQSIIPEVLPREDLRGGIALNTMGMNISRVLGAFIGGNILAFSGPGAVFVLNAITFSFIILVLFRWRRNPPESSLPPEKFSTAVITGLRYTRYSAPLRASIYRSIGFYFFASVMWALFPLIARELLQADAFHYGLLFAAISIGAIINALMLPRIRTHFDNDQMITGASFVFALGIITTALFHYYLLALFTLALCGSAWITVMTCAQTSAQTALPDWVRSRGMAVFLTFFMGSLAIGPALWGGLAQMTSISTSMITASVCLVLAALFTRRWPVSGNDTLDHTPSRHWKTPEPVSDLNPDQGPVMITIEYQIATENRGQFLATINELGKSRRRDGATDWHILEDIRTPGLFREFYLVQTWLDHLRQHERISTQDARLQKDIQAILVEGTSPTISHYIKTTD